MFGLLVLITTGTAGSAAPGKRVRVSARPPARAIAPWRPAIAVLPFTDRTTGEWLLWTGRDVGEGFAEWLSDSLTRSGRWRLPDPARRTAAFATRQRDALLSDANAMSLGASLGAELVLTGVVQSFAVTETQPDPRWMRWGVGSGRRRTAATVVLELRLLDCASGEVVRTTVVKREQFSQSSSSVGGPTRIEPGDFEDTPLGRASHEVVQAAIELLQEEWAVRAQVRVARVLAGAVWLDAGRARGLIPGQRLYVLRPTSAVTDSAGAQADSDRVAAELLVMGFDEGSGRQARCRVERGRVEPGDLVRLVAEAPQRPAQR